MACCSHTLAAWLRHSILSAILSTSACVEGVGCLRTVSYISTSLFWAALRRMERSAVDRSVSSSPSAPSPPQGAKGAGGAGGGGGGGGGVGGGPPVFFFSSGSFGAEGAKGAEGAEGGGGVGSVLGGDGERGGNLQVLHARVLVLVGVDAGALFSKQLPQDDALRVPVELVVQVRGLLR